MSANPTPATSFGGGGGPIWGSTVVATTTADIQSTSTVALATASLKKVSTEQPAPTEAQPTSAGAAEENQSQQKETITNANNPASAPASPPHIQSQQASAIQSGWYDAFIGFVKNVLKKSIDFFTALF